MDGLLARLLHETWMQFQTIEFWIVVLMLAGVDLIFSGENALYLIVRAKQLPDAPPPRIVRWMGKTQFKASLFAGMVGGMAMRLFFLGIAGFIAQNGGIVFLGGVYLVYIGLKPFAKADENQSNEAPILAAATVVTFWGTVWQMELADIGFSLDNVATAIAIGDGNYIAIVFGVIIGIFLLRLLATAIGPFLDKYQWLKPGANILIVIIGLEMMADILFHVEVSPVVKTLISIIVLFIVKKQYDKMLRNELSDETKEIYDTAATLCGDIVESTSKLILLVKLVFKLYIKRIRVLQKTKHARIITN